MLNVHQVFYNEHQKVEFTPYDNRGKLTCFFENEVIRELYRQGKLSHGKLVGVVSHLFRYKSKAAAAMDPGRCMEFVDEGFDVIGFHPRYHYHNMKHNPFTAGDRWHPVKGITFSETCQIILDCIGLDVDVSKRPQQINIIYNNHFFATPSVYAQYCDQVLIPAMEVMELDEGIKQLCWRDSKYTRQRNPKTMEFIKQQLGVNYYPLHPFILERFFTAFLEVNPGTNVKQYGR